MRSYKYVHANIDTCACINICKCIARKYDVVSPVYVYASMACLSVRDQLPVSGTNCQL